MPQGMANPAEPIQGEPTGDTAADVVDTLREFFSTIPKLRGSVWFGGDPILNPEKLAGDQWTVDVWITDPQDQGTITRAAENIEVIYGHLRFHRGQPDPDERAELVASPSQSQAPEPEEGEVPEGAMPPELEQILGGM